MMRLLQSRATLSVSVATASATKSNVITVKDGAAKSFNRWRHVSNNIKSS